MTQAGKRLGTLCLKSDLGAISARFTSYSAIALVAIAGSLLLGYLLSRKLQLQISAPILALADTARTIADQRDYSVRVPNHTRDELGVLTGAFNQMLERMQTQLARLDLLSHTTPRHWRAPGSPEHLPGRGRKSGGSSANRFWLRLSL